MKAKTEELLYLLFWACDTWTRPTFRNLTDSFETWAYRSGLSRQLAELEHRQFLESNPSSDSKSSMDRPIRLTETGLIHVLGGRNPESRWARVWDRRWRLVLFDLPLKEKHARDRLRSSLRQQGFGYLQDSVWISPDPPAMDKQLATKANLEFLIIMEARPCGGETDQQIVSAAWKFDRINSRYENYLNVLKARPEAPLRDEVAARQFRKWAADERASWLAAVSADPLLPKALLPKDYLGCIAWQHRLKQLAAAAKQIREFRFSTPRK